MTPKKLRPCPPCGRRRRYCTATKQHRAIRKRRRLLLLRAPILEENHYNVLRKEICIARARVYLRNGCANVLLRNFGDEVQLFAKLTAFASTHEFAHPADVWAVTTQGCKKSNTKNVFELVHKWPDLHRTRNSNWETSWRTSAIVSPCHQRSHKHLLRTIKSSWTNPQCASNSTNTACPTVNGRLSGAK